jgi:hypothetical protein
MVKQVLIIEAKEDIKKYKKTIECLPWNHKVRRESENIILLFEQMIIHLEK